MSLYVRQNNKNLIVPSYSTSTNIVGETDKIRYRNASGATEDIPLVKGDKDYCTIGSAIKCYRTQAYPRIAVRKNDQNLYVCNGTPPRF